MDQKTAEPKKTAGGLESADVWGDQDDPMNEVNAMTNEQLIAKTREFEADIRKTKT